jgi:hypothetical protein
MNWALMPEASVDEHCNFFIDKDVRASRNSWVHFMFDLSPFQIVVHLPFWGSPSASYF